MEKQIVVSGINIRTGGTLTVYKSFLRDFLASEYAKQCHLIAMVSDRKLFEEFDDQIEFVCFPKERTNRLYRFYIEYFYFKKFSKNRKIDLWISINDKTPHVFAETQVVYCHNPTMFYKCTLKDVLLSPALFLYSIFYKHLYKYNIKNNKYVLVQQNWIAKEFEDKICSNDQLIVFPPERAQAQDVVSEKKDNDITRFIFPAIPKTFKNYEVIFEAVKKIRVENNYEVILTIDGTENRYTQYLKKKYGNVGNVRLVGCLSPFELMEYYRSSDCLIFPSKLETWGLPLSEAISYNLAILCSDLPYAHENVRDYEKVYFFNPDDVEGLANAMEMYMNKQLVWNNVYEDFVCCYPEVKSWGDLIKLCIMEA